ncbi:hypothetical protein ABH931_002672 [Streptacidiphilus sp. MAP12-33]|uniref:hypothetical protein n=1 Tax=Streptacidiphilus sp. MAP12-33 TaxID=3156266 RepID=UPI003511E440
MNSFSPGPVETDLWLGGGGVADTVSSAAGLRPQEVTAQAASATVTGRFSRPSEIADLVVVLASDRAANMPAATSASTAVSCRPGDLEGSRCLLQGCDAGQDDVHADDELFAVVVLAQLRHCRVDERVPGGVQLCPLRGGLVEEGGSVRVAAGVASGAGGVLSGDAEREAGVVKPLRRVSGSCPAWWL